MKNEVEVEMGITVEPSAFLPEIQQLKYDVLVELICDDDDDDDDAVVVVVVVVVVVTVVVAVVVVVAVAVAVAVAVVVVVVVVVEDVRNRALVILHPFVELICNPQHISAFGLYPPIFLGSCVFPWLKNNYILYMVYKSSIAACDI